MVSTYNKQFNMNESKIVVKHSIISTVAQMEGVEPLQAERQKCFMKNDVLKPKNKLSFLPPSFCNPAHQPTDLSFHIHLSSNLSNIY